MELVLGPRVLVTFLPLAYQTLGSWAYTTHDLGLGPWGICTGAIGAIN